jgi:putative DNA primase/helicase
LLDSICEAIARFIICEPETRVAATLWIALTWFIDVVQVAPLAIITAPEKRCGKTQFLDIMGRLSRNPLVASSITPAAVYRVIEAQRPTLLIDEADSFMKDNEELRGVINSGHTRTSAYVIRTVGDDHEPRQFSTWGAKVLCGIGTLPETLMDRAIILELRRKLQNEKVSRLRHAQADMFPTLASKLARFTSDNEHRIKAARPVIPEALNDRAQDNWEPLLAIADCAGGHWPETARKVALKISGGEQESLSTGAELLADIKAAFDQDHSMRLGTAKLIERLCADDMAPWVTWNRGKPLSPRQLAKRLAEYDIRVRKLRIDGSPLQGFERSQFEDAWARYLAPLDTPVLSGTPEQVSNFNNLNVPLTNICSRTDNTFGTANILINNNCSGVPYANPVLGDNTWEVEL